MENGTLCVCIVVFGQDGLLLGIGTADGRTVAVAALYDLPGTDALNPGQLMGMLLVGSTQYLTCVWPGGAEQPLKVHAGDYVLEVSVVIFLSYLRIKGLNAGRQDDGANVYLSLLRLLVEIDGLILTDCFADPTFASLSGRGRLSSI